MPTTEVQLSVMQPTEGAETQKADVVELPQAAMAEPAVPALQAPVINVAHVVTAPLVATTRVVSPTVRLVEAVFVPQKVLLEPEQGAIAREAGMRTALIQVAEIPQTLEGPVPGVGKT